MVETIESDGRHAQRSVSDSVECSGGMVEIVR